MSDLLEVTSELVAISSVSRAERELAEHVARRLSSVTGISVERVGDNLVARSSFGRAKRILLAGHLDTVPPFDEAGPRLEEDVLWGLGAVDMKGGLALMLDLAAQVSRAEADLTLVFYACEEVERSANGLWQLIRSRPELLEADTALLLEPTGGVVEAGCQGSIRAQVTLVGRRAHSARPYMGVNAIHRLGELLRVIDDYEPRTVAIDGCWYTEQLQAVGVSGGVASNVVPDGATLTLNYRFAPDNDLTSAEASLRRLLAPGIDESMGDVVAVMDGAPSAPPRLADPVISRLVEATGEAPRAKVGWTDVATFCELGIPATNFGPGDPLLAHSAHEHISAGELAAARAVLERVLVGTA